MTRANGLVATLTAVLAVALLPTPAWATYDLGRGGKAVLDDGELLWGSTGDQLGTLHDVGIARVDSSGSVLDRAEFSWLPALDNEIATDAARAPDGNVWIVLNALGNFALIEVIPGPPLELDNAPCPNGALTVDLPENAFVNSITAEGNKLYGTGEVGDDMLLVRIDLITCGLDYARSLDLEGLGTPTDEEPDEGRDLQVDGGEAVVVGRSGDKAVVAKTDLDANLIPGFGGLGLGYLARNPDSDENTNDRFDAVVGASSGFIYTGGTVNDAASNSSSFLWRASWQDGTTDSLSRIFDLSAGDEFISDLRYYAGDGFFSGATFAGMQVRGAIGRFDLDDLDADTGCGGTPSGSVEFDFGGADNDIAHLSRSAIGLVGVGSIDNGSESLDYLKFQVGVDCGILTGYAGGASGLRIGFVGARAIGVRQPIGPVNGPPPGGRTFVVLVFRDFFRRARGAAIDLRRGRLGPFVLNFPNVDNGGPDVATFSLVAELRVRGAQIVSAQRRRPRTVRLARGRFNVREGASRRVSLRLSRAGKRALRRARARRVRVRLRLNVRNRAGQRKAFNRTLRLPVKRPRRRGR